MVGFLLFWLEILTSLSSLEHKTIHQLHGSLLSPSFSPLGISQVSWWLDEWEYWPPTSLVLAVIVLCNHSRAAASLSQVLQCQLALSSISERSWKKSQINRRIIAYWGWRRLNFCLAGHLFMGSFSILNWFQSRIMWSVNGNHMVRGRGRYCRCHISCSASPEILSFHSGWGENSEIITAR